MRIVVMGVSGSGKTSLGQRLAAKLSIPFIEGDDLHPRQNIARMSEGLALDDAMREPWLRACGDALAHEASAVLTCSSLKRIYRDILRERAGVIIFIHPYAAKAVIAERLSARQGHFMPTSLLNSQFDTLELPDIDERCITLDATKTLDKLVNDALDQL